jgi:hypothetical protein
MKQDQVLYTENAHKHSNQQTKAKAAAFQPQPTNQPTNQEYLVETLSSSLRFFYSSKGFYCTMSQGCNFAVVFFLFVSERLRIERKTGGGCHACVCVWFF